MKITATIDVTAYLQKTLPTEFNTLKGIIDYGASVYQKENDLNIEVDITKSLCDRHLDCMFNLGVAERIILDILLKLGEK